MHSAHAAAVGATLADFQWNLKTTPDAKAKLEKVEIAPLGDGKQTQVESDKAQDGRIGLDWETGRVYGQAQVRFYGHSVWKNDLEKGNCRSCLPGLACRTLRAFSWRRRQTSARRRCDLLSFSAVRSREMSAHESLSLCSFCEAAKKQFEGVANVEIKVHDLKWAEEHKMGSFISVSRGSDEPLRFLELTYHGAANKDEGEWRPAPLQMG